MKEGKDRKGGGGEGAERNTEGDEEVITGAMSMYVKRLRESVYCE